MSWSKLGTSKLRGEMGFRDLENFNSSLLAKQVCKILTRPSSLATRILKEKYVKHNNPMQVVIRGNSSQTWKSMMSARPLIRDGIRWGVGNGEREHKNLEGSVVIYVDNFQNIVVPIKEPATICLCRIMHT